MMGFTITSLKILPNTNLFKLFKSYTPIIETLSLSPAISQQNGQVEHKHGHILDTV